MQMADAARVVGTTKKAVQKWLERDQIPWLANARGEKGEPADFDNLDLLRMRLVVVLTEYGASIREAADSVWWLMPDGDGVSSDDRAVLLDIHPDDDRRIVCWRDDQGWHEMILDTARPKPDEVVSGRIRRQRDHGKGKLPPAALVIDPVKLFRDVRDRITTLGRKAA